MKIISRIVAAGLTAFLLWAVFPPRGEAYNLVFALAPMLVLTRLSRPRAAAGWWFLGGFAFWFATLAWMPAICQNNGPWPLVALGWFGLAAFCAGYFALFGCLAARAWQQARACTRAPFLARLVVLTVVEPTLWAGLEWLRATLFSGFAWNFLGTGLGVYPDFATPARWGGVYLVSALVVLVNGVFATLLLRAIHPLVLKTEAGAESSLPRTARLCRFAETAVPLMLVYGVLRLSVPPSAAETPAKPLRVALIQRNAACVFSKRDAEDPYRPFVELIDKAALARPDLVLLAESAFAEFGPARSDHARQAALHFANRCGGAAVIGGADDVIRSNGVKRVYNAAAYYSPTVEGALVDVYHKQHLVPFGEYIPLDKWITPLQKLSPIGVSLIPGEPKLFTLDGVKIAPLICFEDTCPPLARAAARNGADVIALITNDSWFSHSVEAEQHAAQAVLRAIECGLPILRVGNSGVTGVITETGATRWLTDGMGLPLVDQPGCQVESVLVRPGAPRPPYVRLGDAPLLVLFALVLAFVFAPASIWEKKTPDDAHGPA